MQIKAGPLLRKINGPEDLKCLRPDELIQLSKELRQFIIDAVACNPGHFGASLGVVELTVALHFAFKSPYDKIIWDVGHQAYGHKILTGRKEVFHTNRKLNGLSGFPNMAESEHDAFGVGHSSTSISAALGMAVAAQKNKENDRQIVAIIGDGALSGGMAFEGLNNAGIQKSNLLIILNDNDMAIDPNVGAIKDYLLDIRTSEAYNRLKADTWKMLGKMRRLGSETRNIVQKLEKALKTVMLRQSNFFESLKFRYFGPVDGHDVVYLSQLLSDLRNIPGPKILHVITKKGKGFPAAEQNQTKWHHAPGQFDKTTGSIIQKNDSGPKPPKFQEVFGHSLLELARENNKILGITPAMPSGSSMNIMMEAMPDRVFDVGIAEQHAVTFSAGLAASGFTPFCNIYSTFMQRAYDQVIHDVALQQLPVIFCLDRGGLVGADGATHHGVFDLAYFRIIPNMIIASPLNELELRNLMYSAQMYEKGPYVIRYPRGSGSMVDWKKPFAEIKTGCGQELRSGYEIAVLSIGPLGNRALRVADKLAKNEKIEIGVYDMRFVKPLDENLLNEIASKYQKIITLEDGVIHGGFGSAVLEWFSANSYHKKMIRLGIPDRFIGHGQPMELHKICGIDPDSMYQTILEFSRTK